MRIKHMNQPEKFMESEIDLHDEIKELSAVAASPDLFPLLVSLGAMKSFLGVLTHENTDISLAAVSLLQELTDPDTLDDEGDDYVNLQALLDEFVAEQGMELVVQNLSRLDEAQDEDAEGISHTFSIIENITQLQPALAEAICQRTNILTYLLSRLEVKAFSPNKLHCSEVLAILLQNSEANQQSVAELQIDGHSGLEHLLQIIFHYRKAVADSSETECIENIFLCLRSALLSPPCRQQFLDNEGFELMIKCLKEGASASACALKTVGYALTGSLEACKRLVDVGGLKYLFPVLMGKAIVKNLSKKKGVKQELEETAISILSELCSHLADANEDAKTTEILHRLVLKFSENSREKLKRCAELFLEYDRRVKRTKQEIRVLRTEISDTGDEEALADFDSEDNIYSRLLNGGLFTLQQLCKILGLVCMSVGKEARDEVDAILSEGGLAFKDVIFVLREAAMRLASDGEADAVSAKATFITFSAALKRLFPDDAA
jgi:beta-catenin-like protein 1